MELSNTRLALPDLKLEADEVLSKEIVKQGIPLLFEYIKNKDNLDIELDESLKIWLETVTSEKLSIVRATLMNDIKLATNELKANRANFRQLENERDDLYMRIDATSKEYHALECTYDEVSGNWQQQKDELRHQHLMEEDELKEEEAALNRKIEQMKREFKNKVDKFAADAQKELDSLSKRQDAEAQHYEKNLESQKTECNVLILESEAKVAAMENLAIQHRIKIQERNKLELKGRIFTTFGAGPLEFQNTNCVLAYMSNEQVSALITDPQKKSIANMTRPQIEELFQAFKNLRLHLNSSFKSCTSDQDLNARNRVENGFTEILAEQKLRALKVCTLKGNIKKNNENVLGAFSKCFLEKDAKKKDRASSIKIKSPAGYIARTPKKPLSLKRSSSEQEQEEECTPMKKRRFNTYVTSPIRTPSQSKPLSLDQAPSSSISRLSLSHNGFGKMPVSDLSFHDE
ncbi:predicted protein [Chaetoceros tenuissimus]|uniref:Uncharacterized protein n=1 Tax=Chaetoceros tenuissimus TaxID=426638 RepID=A0AAD3D3P5_9STRA|nr:predicted protein [Chaetoceros tenuissimus]